VPVFFVRRFIQTLLSSETNLIKHPFIIHATTKLSKLCGNNSALSTLFNAHHQVIHFYCLFRGNIVVVFYNNIEFLPDEIISTLSPIKPSELLAIASFDVFTNFFFDD
jgi:hypothetical protein